MFQQFTIVYIVTRITKNFDENLKKQFSNTHKFSKRYKSKFILLLQKGVVYPSEYIDEWEKFNKTSLPEDFHDHLNMEDITNADYTHVKRVYKDFEVKILEKLHDLHVQSNTLLLADVFEIFRNMCLEIYQFDPACFLTVLELVWQAALKKTKVKLNLLTVINVLLMVEKCIRGGLCHAIHKYEKTNNKYIKDYDENKES